MILYYMHVNAVSTILSDSEQTIRGPSTAMLDGRVYSVCLAFLAAG